MPDLNANLVVPCYNEAERLDVGAFREFSRVHPRFHFLMVDDGSTDRTGAILADLATGPGFSFHAMGANSGKAEAVRQGILRAAGEGSAVVGFMDADLAVPLEALPDLISPLEEDPRTEIVMGSRVRLLGRDIRRKTGRHYFGRVAATAVSVMLDLPVYDTQCGLKLFRVVPRLDVLFDRPFATRWTFDVEILARWLLAADPAERANAGEFIVEMPLDRWIDVHGSKLRPVDFTRAPIDLATIWWKYARHL